MRGKSVHPKPLLIILLSAVTAALIIAGLAVYINGKDGIAANIPAPDAPPRIDASENRRNDKYDYTVNDSMAAVRINKYLGNEKEVEIPDTIDNCTVSEIGEGAFEGSDITSVKMPDGLRTIGESAFSDCTELKTVAISESVREIRSRAFSRCTALTTAELPEGMTYIEESIFYYCTALEKIILPDSAEHVEWTAFWECRKAVITYKGVDYPYENNFHFNNSLKAVIDAQ